MLETCLTANVVLVCDLVKWCNHGHLDQAGDKTSSTKTSKNTH